MTSALEVKNETTLASIAEQPENNSQHLLFAVIIEISEPTKTEEGSNFLTRVKVVDPSFNYKVDLKLPQLKFHKFVHVNIYTETPERAPKIKFVGDIIRLRRFKFRYSERGELKAYEKKYSNWLIYGGQLKDALNATCYKSFTKNIDRELNKYEEGRISDLRYWSDHFFFSNSLRYVSWWNDIAAKEETLEMGREKYTEKKKDLILKCSKVDISKRKLSFIDNRGRDFEIVMNATPALKAGQIVELKCVDLVWEVANKALIRSIQLTPQSSCLHIPAFFWDYRNFEKALGGEKSGATSVKKDLKKFAFLADYTTETGGKAKKSAKKGADDKFVSAVRISHKDKEPTPIAELLRILEEDGQNFVGKRFLIAGHINGFISLEPTEIVKRFYTQDKSIAKLTDKDQRDKKSRIVYHLMPLITDDSVKNDQHLQAYILTNEQEFYMFDAWGVLPNYDDSAAWASFKIQKVQDFIKKLNGLKKPENKVKMVVQLMMTKSNKFFYKVVDTVFLPF